MNLDVKILKALRGCDSGWVSGTELSLRSRVTRAAVWARIEELRRLGYEIQATPHRGYRLLRSPDVLHGDDLMARLGKVRVIGRGIRVFQKTASTSNIVDKLARDGVPEGEVVFAEAQTQGRGRLGRRWSSPSAKGLWFSVLLRPALRSQEITRLTIAAATALARAIESATELHAAFKWPNDLLLNGRKAAGILTELRGELDRVRYAILGIGVDVNQTQKDFPTELRATATSLRIEVGELVDRSALAAEILRELDRDYARVCHEEFDSVAAEWESRCSTLGRQVEIRAGSRLLKGRAESLDDDGALLVRTHHGRLEHVIGGDVTLEK